MRTLKKFLERVQVAKLTPTPKKWKIGYESVDFLEHTASNNRISPKEEAIEKIVELPRTQSKKQIRSFLGAVNYYRHFFTRLWKDYTTTHRTYRKEREKHSRLKPRVGESIPRVGVCIVEETHPKITTQPFQELKYALSRKPILMLPNMDQVFVMRADASDVAIGCVLTPLP